MKKLFFALICTVIGFSASASNLTPEKETPAVAKVETTTTFKAGKSIETVKLSEAQLGLFRRQMNFTFQDACGKGLTIYVSGASAASDRDLWKFAWDYFVNAIIHSDNGCL